MIAHEIKNPLTPIRLSAEHMKEVWDSEREAFAEVFESCTSNILRQVDELQEIAADFSTYSRIPKFDPRATDLVGVIRQVVEGYRTGLSNRVTIELVGSETVVEALVDEKLLGRAVRNLIENALRVSEQGTGITVGVDRLGDEVRVSVADEGPGVRESLLQTIFDPYFSTHDTGTGLGLPIARRIVEEHGGEIVARNRPSGGLEVTMTLPLRTA